MDDPTSMDFLHYDLDKVKHWMSQNQDQNILCQALAEAVHHGKMSSAVYMARQGVPIIKDPGTPLQDNPLHLACYNGHMDFILQIPSKSLSKGTQVTCVMPDGSKCTALQCLLEYWKTYRSTKQMNYSLNCAKFTKVIARLVSHGANINVPQVYGLLFHALYNKKLDLLNFLLEQNVLTNVCILKFSFFVSIEDSEKSPLSILCNSQTVKDDKGKFYRALKHVLNKGALSKIYREVSGRFMSEGLVLSENAINDVTIRLMAAIAQSNAHSRKILQCLCDNDVLLHISSQLKRCVVQKNREMNNPALALLEENIKMPSLKRLCRRMLRELISTNYAVAHIGFDLRQACSTLPIPVPLQQYIPV